MFCNYILSNFFFPFQGKPGEKGQKGDSGSPGIDVFSVAKVYYCLNFFTTLCIILIISFLFYTY